MEKIRIKYLYKDIDKIQKATCGDWIDLRSATDIEIGQGCSKLIPLGVAMELPEGYEAIIAPRSSTFKYYSVLCSNSIGVIDESYKGDNDQWHFPVYATENTFIPKNTRICQFRIIKHQPSIEFEEVEHLGNADRNGFGSTGRK